MKILNYKPRRKVGEPTESSALKIGLAIVFFLFPLFTDASTIARPLHNASLVGYWSMEEGAGLGMMYKV